MRIRKAELGDELGIAKVHVDTWNTTYRGLVSDKYIDSLNYEIRAEKWRDLIVNNESIILVAVNNENKIIGYVFGGKNRDEDSTYQGELYAIYVLEEYQNKKIGSRLIKSFALELTKRGYTSMIIWVLKGNSSSQFYKSLGGKKLKSKAISIDGKAYNLNSYGFDDIYTIINIVNQKERFKSNHMKGLAHIGIYTNHLETSKNFYLNSLGFELVTEVDLGKLKIAMVRLNDLMVELLESSEKEFIGDGHIEHFAIEVTDIDVIVKELKEKGVQFLQEEPIFNPKLFNGIKIIFMRGPSNEKIELFEYLKAQD